MKHTWRMTSLGEVLVERREIPSDLELMSGATPIIAKIGFNDGRIELRDGGQTRTKMIRIQPGDLVISGINAAKGAVAIYGSDQPGPIAATIHYSSYAPVQGAVDVRFLWWLFRSGFFRQVLSDQVPGGIKTELKPNRLLPIAIPLPPLAEQQRILARVDALASRIDEAKKLRAQAVQEIEAVMGAIIAGIQVNSPDGYLLDVLVDKPRNGWSVVCDNDPQGIAVLTLSAVTGFVFRKNEFKTTSAFTDSAAHYWLSPGDILITRSNTPELVGHAAIYLGEPYPCIYPDLMMRLQVNERKADRRFLWYWLRGPLVREFIRRKAKGTSPTMKKISQKIVMEIPFPTQLSMDRQKRVVAQLDNLQAKVDAVKRLQAETQAELDALLPAVLDRAFRGALMRLAQPRLLRYNACGSERANISMDIQKSSNVLTDDVLTVLDSTSKRPITQDMTGAELAVALAALDVPFIAGGSHQPMAAPPQPAVLLASLAASDEARLRLALIPLLLRHPEYARHAAAALRLMPPAAQTCFKCYYCAAVLLQEKHRRRLETTLGRLDPLPNLFSTELGLPDRAHPDDALRILAMHQRDLTGRSINWLGTYEHGANRMLQALERREQWQV